MSEPKWKTATPDQVKGDFPWFTFSPRNWMEDRHIREYLPESEGLYIRILSVCWTDQDCSIPVSKAVQSRLFGVSNRNQSLLKVISNHFIPHPYLKNRLTNKRLLIERMKCVNAYKASVKGGESTKKHWEKVRADAKVEAITEAKGAPIGEPVGSHRDIHNNKDINKVIKEEGGEEKPSPPAPKYTDDDFDLAMYFLTVLEARKPDFILRGSIGSWADVIRLMRTQDKRQPEIIKDVWNFSQGHHFWSINILSAGSLRKQFDKLQLEMKKKGPPPKQAAFDKKKENIKKFAENHQSGKPLIGE